LGAIWGVPVWAHLVALALVLVALMAVVGTSSSFSADEGAAIVEARSLASGGGWVVEHPMPAADPGAVNYPLELSDRGVRGSAPYAKHPLYPLLLAGADRLGGVRAMVLLSLIGTIAAAGVAGALARWLDPGRARGAGWGVGLASPLFFDGSLVIAHTLGAALAGAAVLLGIVAVERRSPRTAVAVVPAMVACVLLRNEGLFIAGALAVVAGVISVRRSDVRVVAAVVAIGSLAAGAGAHVVDRLWMAHLVGAVGSGVGSAANPATSDPAGLVNGRVQGFLVTWLTPGYGVRPVVGLLLLVVLVAVAFGAIMVRRHPTDSRRIVGSATAAAGAAIAAVVAGPGTVVPGLLVAFPFAYVGLLLLSRRTLRTDTARITATVSALFAVAVLATQYAKGGSGEWGGRYFALAIPVAVPVLLLALWDQRDRLTPVVARRAAAAMVVCSLALTTMGVTALRSYHRANARLVAAVDHAGLSVAADHPIMVTTEGAMPRLAWSTFDRQSWLLADTNGLGDLLDRLKGAGVTRLVFVSRNIDRDRDALDGAGARIISTDRSESARRWEILVLQIA
jgi:hypothetical protein